MAKGRLSMTKLMEILRLRLGEKLSLRETARSVNCSPSKVHNIVVRFKTLELGWPLDSSVDEATLETIIYESAPIRLKGPNWNPLKLLRKLSLS